MCEGGDCDAAATILSRQIAAMADGTGTVSPYPHPNLVVYVLPGPPGGSGSSSAAGTPRYHFARFHGVAHEVRVRGRAIPLYCLEELPPSPAAGSGGGAFDALLDSAIGRIASVALSESPAPGTLDVSRAPEGLASALAAFCGAAREASAFAPAFDEVKARYSFGVQTFYESRAPASAANLAGSIARGGFTLPELRGFVVAGEEGHCKSMFSDQLSAEQGDASRRARCGSASR